MQIKEEPPSREHSPERLAVALPSELRRRSIKDYRVSTYGDYLSPVTNGKQQGQALNMRLITSALVFLVCSVGFFYGFQAYGAYVSLRKCDCIHSALWCYTSGVQAHSYTKYPNCKAERLVILAHDREQNHPCPFNLVPASFASVDVMNTKLCSCHELCKIGRKIVGCDGILACPEMKSTPHPATRHSQFAPSSPDTPTLNTATAPSWSTTMPSSTVNENPATKADRPPSPATNTHGPTERPHDVTVTTPSYPDTPTLNTATAPSWSTTKPSKETAREEINDSHGAQSQHVIVKYSNWSLTLSVSVLAIGGFAIIGGSVFCCLLSKRHAEVKVERARRNYVTEQLRHHQANQNHVQLQFFMQNASEPNLPLLNRNRVTSAPEMHSVEQANQPQQPGRVTRALNSLLDRVIGKLGWE